MTPGITIEIIKEMHAKHKKMEAIKKRNRELAEDIRKSKKERKKEIWENEANVNHYTDASKYANEYYGSVKYHTERFDDDWD